MTIRWEPKLAGEVRDYTHDWTPFLVADTIVTSVFTVAGVTKDSDTILSGDQSVKVWLSAGVAGVVASVTNTITTAAGRTETETFVLPIIQYDEPITLAEAKAQVRVDGDNDDNYITTLVPAARRYVENRTGLVIKRRQFIERHMPVRGAIRLYNGPVVSIDEVAYPDNNGADQTYSGARYFVGSPFIFPAIGEMWPYPYQSGYYGREPFTVTYTAGLSPEQLGTDDYANLLHAMKLLVGHWFANREAVVVERAQALSVPLTVDDLCDQVRALLV